MKKIYKLMRSCITILAAMAVLNGYAQDSAVTGRVTAEDAPEGLPGVTVFVKGTSTGTITDIDGNFRVTAGSDAILSFSFIGYKTLDVPLNGRTTVNVDLKIDQTALDEVVVIGYGEQNRRDLTGSVVSVKSEELSQTTPTSALEGMRGRLSGVQITANGGPGEAADIQIRGISTLGGAGGPLYVVDGQQLDDINNINPDDIASIEVLKDGASAAIYGSRSANGVIIITTKKGKSGKAKISANYIRTYSALASKIPVSNTRQARQFEIARTNTGDPLNPGPPTDSLDAQFNNDFDYQEIITRVGVRDQIGLSLSGGSDDANFYWNTGFLNQEGVIRNSDFQRINTTINMNFNVADRIKSGTRIIASYSERNGLNEGAVFGQLATHFPFLPTRDQDGTFVPQTSSQQNVEAETLLTVRQRRDYDGQIFSYLEFELLPALKFKSTLGVLVEVRRDNDFDPILVQPIGRPPSGDERTQLNFSLQQENYLTYKKSFGDHNISALAGVQIQTWRDEFARHRSTEFNNDIVRTFNNAGELDASNTLTTATGHALASQYGRITYDYKGKYLFAATVRRDGSSRFGSANQYGTFPGLSVGWRVSDESFWSPLANVVSDFKIRAGISENGNERIGNFDSRSLYVPGFLYNGVNGIALDQIGNENLRWETTRQSFVGTDFGFLGGRITASLDYYEKNTFDLLFNTPLPQETGFSVIRDNVAEIRNTGIEFNLSGNVIENGDLKWYSSFNIATNKNEVVKLSNDVDQIIDGNYSIREGNPIGDFWGYTALGVFAYDESNAFDSDGNQLTPVFDESGGFVQYELNGETYTGDVNQLTIGSVVLQGGDAHWADLNGDFNIDAGNDRSVIGNGYPKFFGGFYNEFTYKGVKLSIMMDYNFGNDIYRQYDETRNQRLVRTVLAGPDRIDEAWYNPGDVAKFPTLSSSRTSANNIGPNSFWISDADFIKLRSVRIDYTLPKSVMSKLGLLSGVSVYASGNNLLTWTNYVGYNPELGTRGNAREPGTDNLRYPLSREYILGINVNF